MSRVGRGDKTSVLDRWGFGWGRDSIELYCYSYEKIEVISNDDGGLCDREMQKRERRGGIYRVHRVKFDSRNLISHFKMIQFILEIIINCII